MPLSIPLPGTVPASSAALLVAGDERPFALVGKWAGGGAICGSEPGGWSVLASHSDAYPDHPHPDVVGGGWFGVLGFQLGREVERIGDPPPRPIPAPSSLMQFYDHVLRCDSEGQWWFEALEESDRVEQRRIELAERLTTGVSVRHVGTDPWRSTPGPHGHAAAVQAARARIFAGDLFQANLTVRLESTLRVGTPADLFTQAVTALEPDRAAFVQAGEHAVASLSPELFLERKGRRVRSAPIKGTAAKGERDALVASRKDRAENVMIVDLVRNDLGRVCVPGSIEVPALAEPRAHTGVWHLVSEVAGTLRDDATDVDLLRAAFPPGSVTGAPKVAALDVIHELESTGREAYCGAIGFVSPVAGLELNVAIRTFEISGDRIWLGVGGGVVADSDPAAEAREAATKAKPLLDAIGARLAEPRRRARATPPMLRLGPKPIPRPDPGQGVFETIRAEGGEALHLEAHLDRLERSVKELYGGRAEGARELAARAAEEVGDGRVRIDARPEHGAITLAARSGRVEPQRPVELRAVCLPGGLGGHKWIDRRLIDALTEAMSPAVPLFVDLDGVVLEAARANVAIVEGGEIVTPPLDGRILPGVGRADLGAREEHFDLDRLHAADEVLTVSALRGAQPAQVLMASTISSGASSWM